MPPLPCKVHEVDYLIGVINCWANFHWGNLSTGVRTLIAT